MLKTALDKLKAGGHTTLCTIVSAQHSCLAPSGDESSLHEVFITSTRGNRYLCDDISCEEISKEVFGWAKIPILILFGMNRMETSQLPAFSRAWTRDEA